MKIALLLIFALQSWAKSIELPLILLPVREKSPPKVMALYDSSGTSTYFFSSPDLKTWVVQLCGKADASEQGLYIFDTKGLRRFSFQPKDQFESVCASRCQGCAYKAETNKLGEVTAIQLDWDVSEISGRIKLQVQGSKLKVKECYVEGHASDPATTWPCK